MVAKWTSPLYDMTPDRGFATLKMDWAGTHYSSWVIGGLVSACFSGEGGDWKPSFLFGGGAQVVAGQATKAEQQF